jgi:hypothetical protein
MNFSFQRYYNNNNNNLSLSVVLRLVFSLKITLTLHRDPICWGRKCMWLSTFSQTVQKWAKPAGEVKHMPSDLDRSRQ